VNDLVDQADLMLQAAWNQENAPLFRDLNRVGRNELDAIGPQTLHNELKWERLGVQMVILLMSLEDKAASGFCWIHQGVLH
jgi:hypothetical protein